MLSPAPDLPRLRALLNELQTTQRARERRTFLPNYPGFHNVFRCRIRPAPEATQLSLDPSLDIRLERVSEPHRELVTAFTQSLRQLKAIQSLFDVVVFYLPKRWENAFAVGDFHLHDMIKAVAAQMGLATQIITDDAIEYPCRGSVAWRLGQALFCQSGRCALQTRNEHWVHRHEYCFRWLGLCNAEARRRHHRIHRLCESNIRLCRRGYGFRGLRRLRRRGPRQPPSQPRTNARCHFSKPRCLRRSHVGPLSASARSSQAVPVHGRGSSGLY